MHNFTTSLPWWRMTCDQTYDMANTLSVKNHWYLLKRRLGCSQSCSGCFGEEEILLVLLEFEPQTSQPIAQSLYRLCYRGLYMGGAYLIKFWFSQFWQCLGLFCASCLYSYRHNICSAQITTCYSGHKASLSEFSFSNTDILPNLISLVHIGTFISLKPI